MWLLADGLAPFSDGVCAFLGSGPILFWLGKSQPFMLWLEKIKPMYVIYPWHLIVGRGKKGKTHYVCGGQFQL